MLKPLACKWHNLVLVPDSLPKEGVWYSCIHVEVMGYCLLQLV